MSHWLLTKGDTVSTFRWWTVASDRCASFKQVNGQEPEEKVLLLCDDDLSLLMDLHPSRTFRDWSRTEGKTVSTLRWWSVATDRCGSFQQVDEQVENWKRHCFYFAMMICCCKQMPVLHTNWWTGREPKETLFLLFDDELLLQTELSPLSKWTNFPYAKGVSASTLSWWYVGGDGSPSYKYM